MPCEANCQHNSCTGLSSSSLRHPAARPSRRAVVGSLAAFGASAVLGAPRVLAQNAGQGAAGNDWIIDTHHHIYPPRYVNANLKRIVEDSGALPASAYTSWSPQRALEQMDKAGVRSAVVSMTSPGIWWGNTEEGRTWARECNEFGAQMAKDFPGRFGMFAAIPLPDTEGSLREIAYALDTLKLDGIGLLTSYAGKPLGDPSFAAVFDELNRRKVAVFVHPTMSCCGMSIPGIDPPAIDFSTDTTRTLASLAYSGTFARSPDVKFIFSHGGGTMPFLLSRFTREESVMKDREQRLPRGVLYELKKFHYDTAQANHAGALAALVRVIPVSQVLYGSDFPFRPGSDVNEGLAQFRFKPRDLRAIDRDNALKLLPSLKT